MKHMIHSVRSRVKKNDGFIIMISLWILALVSLLSLGLAHRVAINVKLVKFQKDKLQCFYAAKAAVHKAISVLQQDDIYSNQTTTLNQLWSAGYDVTQDEVDYIFKDIVVGDAFFTVRYPFDDTNKEAPVYFYGMSDEDRKININSASRDLLRTLFGVLEFSDPDSLADAIIYWRGDDQEAQDAYYASTEIPYKAPKAPFQTIEELSLVKGFRGNGDIITTSAKYLSIFPEEININTASPFVLKAVFLSLGADADFAQRLVDTVIGFRAGGDAEQGSEDDVAIVASQIKTVLKTGLTDGAEKTWVDNHVFPFTAHSQWFRIEAVATVSSSVIRKKVEAIVSIPENYRIVYWHEA